MANYADVILPLPIKGTFTYSVPDELYRFISLGSRVYVQFGARKNYTGIVVRLHSDAPQGFDVKPILTILDSDPILRYPQLKLWQWVSDYYLCTIGEVYKAAVPAGLKIESELCVTLNPDYEDELENLPDSEYQIAGIIKRKPKLPIRELEKSFKTPMPVASLVLKMMKKGVVDAAEEATTRYRPKTIQYVTLCGSSRDNDWLHQAFDLVRRSLKQEQALIAMLDLIHQNRSEEVPKTMLMEKAKVSPSIISALQTKGVVKIFKKKINRYAFSESKVETSLAPLSPIQKEALDAIYSQWKEKDVVLLRGITGSGKTEIYCHAITEALRRNDQALFLVPEISLTTQLTDRLRGVFGDKLLVYHSRFSDSERVDIWNKILNSKEPLVVLGPRSALFLPFAHLGIVIVDEEHESSYKQHDPAPRYNARDTAIVLANMHHAPVLLGSATPSVETYYKAQTGKYGLVELLQRYSGATLPAIEIVDMKEQRKKKLNEGIISQPLKLATLNALKENKQAIMFQNRRGYAPMVVCTQCGWTPKCVNCDVGMVYHKTASLLQCHYCGYLQPLPSLCPVCGGNSIETYGFGTERIADNFHSSFDKCRVARMDYDTTRNKNSYQEIIEEFASHKTDILIGTQMVSKGLDFDNVKLVGIMNADGMLSYPDFRATERAFSLMVQVAGRAGRRQEKGSVVVQTTDPANKVLEFIKNHDYEAFYNYEIEQRRKFAYPPFTRIINFYLKHKDARQALELADIYAAELRKLLGPRVLGPVEPTIARKASYYYQTIMIKIETQASMQKLKQLLASIYERLAADNRFKQAYIYYDVDPA